MTAPSVYDGGVRLFAVGALLAGCSFHDGAALGLGSGSGSAIDAPNGDIMLDIPALDAPPMFDIVHVSTADQAAVTATADVDWGSGPVMIDTMALTVTPALPMGARIHMIAQDPSGPDLAILEVHSLTSTGTITVHGARPLVIYAVTSMTIGGTLDAGAHGAMMPGPGALTSGSGLGLAGTHAGTYSDGGGGGGSFGTAGARGGNASETAGVTGNGGAPGTIYGDAQLSVLQGGVPGGGAMPNPCGGAPMPPLGGAGGGAIQLSSPAITLDGTIIAGGGGGQGGILCTGNMSSAGGGGSGGAIYVQAFMLAGNGKLVAGGGGGGSGANWGGGGANQMNGHPGGDANMTTAAQGGATVLTDGGAGGNGAAATAATQGADVSSTYPDGGGGGGGAGRVYLAIPASTTVSLTSAPMYVRP